ncbi:hypothetical protein BDR26DRAFT_936637 [Obelidium mucronatum]|nr:hypothetical protein BDR26DRAFT_936637 [Obelidium mucronatum]
MIMAASPDNALAIASFEDAIIASAGPEVTTDPTASRKDLVTRALLSKGNVALSIAVKGTGGEILWAETYGTVRNAAGLKAASEKDPNTVEILYPSFCDTPELKQEWKEWQLSVRETLVQESMADTDASVGLTAGSNLSADTAFQAASVSKPITAVAVMLSAGVFCAGISWLLSGEYTKQIRAGVDSLVKFYNMPIRATTSSNQQQQGVDEGELKTTVFPSCLAECIGTYIPRNPLLAANNTVIRVSEGSEKNTLVFHFDSIKGAIPCKQAGDDTEKNSFSFAVVPRMDVVFTVESGLVLLSWSVNVHIFSKRAE